MGFESFRVELRNEQATTSVVKEIIRMLPHVRPDNNSFPMQSSTYFVMDDRQHVIELESMGSPTRLSCRFTLCHPPSVDSVFLSLLRELMSRLGMEAKICDDVEPNDVRFFTLDEFEEFSTAVLRYIASRRREWISAFGNKTLAATTKQVHEQIIIPLCQSEIEQPS